LAQPQPLAGIRVLVAEDHDDTRYVFEEVLRSLGATITTVALAREALDLVAVSDVIVTDLAMPGEDGVWLLEQVNARSRPIPVIVVSGFAESHVPRLAQAPFARKLLKPVDPWRLAEVILEVVRGRAAS